MTRSRGDALPAAPRRRSDVRVTLAYLRRELLPATRRAGVRPLVRAVQQAIDAKDPSLLGRLPERLRRDLLEMTERLVARSRRADSPRAIVGLTAAVTADALPEAGAGRRLAPPAR